MDLTMLKCPGCEITFGVDKKLSGTTNWWPRPWRPRAHLLPISHRSTGYTPAWNVRRIDAPPIGHRGRLLGGGQPGSGRCAGGIRWLFGLEQSIGSWRITGLQRDSVSAELLNQNVVATNFVAGCQEVGLAEAALQALSDEGIRLGESVPQDSAARQEGSLVRVSKS